MKNHQKLAISAFVAVFLLLANGCIPSLQPIYTEDKLVAIKELPGTWVDAANELNFTQQKTVMGEKKDVQVTVHQQQKETWRFKADGDKRYQLIHIDNNGNAAAFDIHVIKLGSDFFMDFYPTSMPNEDELKQDAGIGNLVKELEKMNSLKAFHVYPVHNFAKLEVGQKQLKITMFDPDFLKNLLENQQIRIKHEKTEEGFILTASSQELQKFAEKYAHVKEAFLDDPIVLNRKTL